MLTSTDASHILKTTTLNIPRQLHELFFNSSIAACAHKPEIRGGVDVGVDDVHVGNFDELWWVGMFRRNWPVTGEDSLSDGGGILYVERRRDRGYEMNIESCCSSGWK